MSKSLLLMICILTGLLVLACSKPADTNRNAAAPANSNAAVPAGTVSTNKNTNASTTAGEKIGVEECDTFLTAYEHCVTSKIPEASRAQFQTSINTLRSQWKKLADNPQTRGTLAAACKSQHEAAKAQVKSFGCTL